MKDWERSERDALIYGRKTPGSGSGLVKMDIIGEGDYSNWIFENKSTVKSSFSIKVEMIRKGFSQAKTSGRKPVFRIDFVKDNLKMIMIEEKEWIRLHEMHSKRDD